jgi:single-strand DNA-binding protein
MALPTITLVGNLTADPELRVTNSGKQVCNLRVACNERKKNEAGEWVDGESVFLDVSCWKNPESINSTLAKGSKVLILGTLRANDYEKDGVRIRGYRVNADEVSKLIIGAKGESNAVKVESSTDGWTLPNTDSVAGFDTGSVPF